MAVTSNRLFPPVMDAYIPAIPITAITSGLVIPFETTHLNNIQDIEDIHVSITRQTNYQSLFKEDPYALGIYVVGDAATAQAAAAAGQLTIPAAALANGNDIQLSFNEYYKVQVRFSSDTYVYPYTESGTSRKQDLSTYLQDESSLSFFSEWSTVGLIRFIAPPELDLIGTIHGDSNAMIPNTEETAYSLDSSYLKISGRYNKADSTVLTVNFPGSSDNEYLSSWKVQVRTTEDETLIDSGIQMASYRGGNINELNYKFPFYFENNTTYKIVLTITTANMYTTSYNYYVKPSYTENSWGSQSLVNEFTNLDSVIGKVNVTFVPAGQDPIPADTEFIIRRASQEDDFLYWDTIWSKKIAEPIVPGQTSESSLSYDDFTIESGTMYKYAITYISVDEHIPYTIVVGPILSVFDHAFLTGEGTQLCVKFNPNINSYKINISDNTLNTIGSKYPFITRNGNMRYRTFSLSGTIAYEMDEEHQFATRSSIYGEWINVYGTYFVNRYINQYNDRITQRKFRELVMDYLYDDVPKLFRSTPEGNILVRLTDVSLTPNQQLGRMIYDFTCTAVEIGDCNIENYKLYKIQDFGDE